MTQICGPFFPFTKSMPSKYGKPITGTCRNRSTGTGIVAGSRSISPVLFLRKADKTLISPAEARELQ